MTIIVDLRCLNYKPITGVNAYCIRFLHCLYINKNKYSQFKILGLGLHKNRQIELNKDFYFFEMLFEGHLTLGEYLNTSTKNSRLNEIKTIGSLYTKKNINSSKVKFFDLLLLPQPRPILKHPNTKLITVVHDIFSILDRSSNLTQKIIYSKTTLNKILSESQKTIVNSMATGYDIQKYFKNKSQINLVYPSLPKLSEISTKVFLTEGEVGKYLKKITKKPFILALSGIEKRKNWLNLIKAYNILAQKNQESPSLILAGTIVDQKYYKQILNLIQKLNLKSIIWFLNPTEEEKEFLLKNCCLFVYPSIYEGFGFPILEALQFETKVLTSSISSMPEVGGQNCKYINPFNPLDIFFGIVNNLNKEKTREQNCVVKFDWLELEVWLEKNVFEYLKTSKE